MTRPVHERSVLAGRREWAALVVLVLAVVLLSVDSTVLALAVPSLTAALRPDAGELLWIADVYSFALAGLLVLMGGLAGDDVQADAGPVDDHRPGGRVEQRPAGAHRVPDLTRHRSPPVAPSTA